MSTAKLDQITAKLDRIAALLLGDPVEPDPSDDLSPILEAAEANVFLAAARIAGAYADRARSAGKEEAAKVALQIAQLIMDRGDDQMRKSGEYMGLSRETVLEEGDSIIEKGELSDFQKMFVLELMDRARNNPFVVTREEVRSWRSAKGELNAI